MTNPDPLTGAGGSQSGNTDEQRLRTYSRIAIVFVAVTLIWLLLMYVNQLAFGSDYTRIGHVVNGGLATALAVPTVVFARRFLDRRPLVGLGLSPMRTGWRSFLIGMACYLIPAGLGLGVVLALGWVEISLDTSIPAMVTLILGLVVLVFLYEALPEELVFRGYIYRNLSASVPRWVATVGQALLFSLWGASLGWISADAGFPVGRLILFFFIALVIGVIRVTTGDVWSCVGFHLAFQTVQQLFAGGWAAGVFVVSDPQSLENVVFGLIPLALAILILELIAHKDVDWRTHNPDSIPTEEPRAK